MANKSGRGVREERSIEESAELTDARDNTEIWGQHYGGKNTEITSLEQQIAGDLADKLRSKLSTSEKQPVAKQGTPQRGLPIRTSPGGRKSCALTTCRRREKVNARQSL